MSSRLRFVAAALCVPALVLSACGEERAAPGAPATSVENSVVPATEPPATPTVTPSGAETATKPSVVLPKSAPTELAITDRRTGTGPKAETGSVVVLNYVGVVSTSGAEFDNSYDSAEPFAVTLGAGGVIEGWEKGLIGVQAGGERQLDIPNAMAYGASDRGEVIKSGDALSFVVEVLAVAPPATEADAPKLPEQATANADQAVVEDLVVGTGEEWTDQRALAHMALYDASTGKVLQSTWVDQEPQTMELAGFPESVAVALGGMKAGGRRQIQVPYAPVFGETGNTNIGLAAKTDLIVIIELIALY